MIKRLLGDKRNLVMLLLACLFAIKIPQAGNRFFFWVAAGLLVAAASDMAINRLFLRRRVFPKSAIISGFIVSGILDFRQPWFVLAIFVLLAVLSKHLIKFKGRHILNPANFGLFAASLTGVPLAWAIESNIYLIIGVGLYVAYSLRKIPHIAGFLIFFTALFLSQGINPLLLVSWFFIFIMLIEPKTSGAGNLRGFVFGSIAAISSFFIYKFFPRYDFLVCSLFFANLCNPLLERLKTKKT